MTPPCSRRGTSSSGQLELYHRSAPAARSRERAHLDLPRQQRRPFVAPTPALPSTRASTRRAGRPRARDAGPVDRGSWFVTDSWVSNSVTARAARPAGRKRYARHTVLGEAPPTTGRSPLQRGPPPRCVALPRSSGGTYVISAASAGIMKAFRALSARPPREPFAWSRPIAALDIANRQPKRNSGWPMMSPSVRVDEQHSERDVYFTVPRALERNASRPGWTSGPFTTLCRAGI